MNRIRSSSVLFPASLLLLLAASCKGPSNEAAATEPFDDSYDDEVEPFDDSYDDEVEPFDYSYDDEVEPFDYSYDDAVEPELALDPEQGEPSAEVPSDAADAPSSDEPDAPSPDSPSPAPPPPPTAPPTAPQSSSSSSAPDDGLTSSRRLEQALSKDAASDTWGAEPFMRYKESLKPRLRDNYVFLLFGSRNLTDEAWKPVDTPGTGGINYLAKGPGGWFHWDMAFSYGAENGNVNGVEVESTIWEIDFGITKIFAPGKVVRPYLGVGLTYMRAGGQVITPTGPIDDSGNSFGGYGRAGLAFDVTDWGGLIGIDVRYVGGTSVSFGPYDTNADGVVGSITFGYSW